MAKRKPRQSITTILDSLEMELVMPESKEVWLSRTKKKTSKKKQLKKGKIK
jgi:hypothetical protein